MKGSCTLPQTAPMKLELSPTQACFSPWKSTDLRLEYDFFALKLDFRCSCSSTLFSFLGVTLNLLKSAPSLQTRATSSVLSRCSRCSFSRFRSLLQNFQSCLVASDVRFLAPNPPAVNGKLPCPAGLEDSSVEAVVEASSAFLHCLSVQMRESCLMGKSSAFNSKLPREL